MENKKTYHTCSDFLKDTSFIRWQIMSDTSLDEYWQNFIKENPNLVDEINIAIDYLKKELLNKSELTKENKILIFNNIKNKIAKQQIQKVRRIFIYASSACIILAISIGIYLFQYKSSNIDIIGKELIVGNQLNNENIQIISGGRNSTYQNDIIIKIDEEGKAKVTNIENKEDEYLDIDESTHNRLIVPFGKRSQLILDDGSSMWLNSGTILEFPSVFLKHKREIRLLEGEIYIEVAPDPKRSFYVKTEKFDVKVYGTKFNLSLYESEQPSVVLVEGKISMLPSYNIKDEILLASNDQAIYTENGNIIKQKVNVDNFISWKNGYLIFNETPMPDVLKEIGRYYNLSFNYDNDINLQKRACTGKIYLSKDLDNVMKTLAVLSSLKYNRTNDIIYITN